MCPPSNDSFIHSAVGTREDHIISSRQNNSMLVPKKNPMLPSSKAPVNYEQAGVGLIFMRMSIYVSKTQEEQAWVPVKPDGVVLAPCGP